MKGFSKAIVAGNVTRDPELRATPSGAQACNFAVAVNRQFKGSDGSMQEQVSFLDCVAWGRTGETIAQYVKKGSGILVSGRLDQRSWEDKATGQRRSRVEITVEDFSFLGGADSGRGGAGTAPRASSSSNSHDAGDFAPDDMPEEDAINLDDIPF